MYCRRGFHLARFLSTKVFNSMQTSIGQRKACGFKRRGP
jgi:hypothetical protein